MKALIGDIGNTVTKVCLIETKNFKIEKMISFNTSDIYSVSVLKKNFNKVVKKEFNIKIALFSNVVPKYELFLKKFIYKFYNIKFKEIKNKSINKIVKLNVKKKNEVGSDRIANAVGVYKKYKANCIVLDLGTATTFDVVTKNGVYNGGVIAPGVNLSIKSLSDKADRIKSFSLKKPKTVVGKNTLEALYSGFYWGYSGLINNIILKIENQTKLKYKIIFTGGYSNLFTTSLVRSYKIDKNITIFGIIEIFKKNIRYLT